MPDVSDRHARHLQAVDPLPEVHHAVRAADAGDGGGGLVTATLRTLRADFARGLADAEAPLERDRDREHDDHAVERESAAYWLGHAEGIRARVAHARPRPARFLRRGTRPRVALNAGVPS